MAPFSLDELRQTPGEKYPEQQPRLRLEEVGSAQGPEDEAIRQVAGASASTVAQTAYDLRAGLYESIAGLDHLTANTFMLLDKAAQGLSSLTGLDRGGAFAQLEQFYRREADEYARRAAETPIPNVGSRISRVIGGLPIGLASAGAAATAGGPVGGFAALGAVERADQGPVEALKGAAGGAAMGKLFGLTHGASRLGRAGTLGSAQVAISTAQGAPPEEALTAGATMGVLGAIAPPAPGAPRLRDIARTHRDLAAAKTEQMKAKLLGERKATAEEVQRAEVMEKESPGAPFVTIEPGLVTNAQGPAPSRVINLNLDRIQGPEDFKVAQARLTQVMEPEIQAARRGTISLEQTRQMADDLGMTVEQLMARRRGQAFNAEEITAARLLHQSIFKDLVTTARKVADPTLGTAVDEARLAKLVTMFQGSAESMLGATAEAGRTLSALRLIAGPTRKGLTEVNKALEGFKAKGPDGKPIGVRDMAQMLSTLEEPGAVARTVREWKQPTKMEKAVDIWINWGLLSGPQTHAVNAISNAATSLWTIPETYVAGGFGALRAAGNRALGRPTPDRVFLREGNARVWGFLQGARDGLVAAGKALRSGEPSDLFGKDTKLDAPTRRLPGRLLVAGDEFFKNVGYRMELHARAVRQAAGEGLRRRAFHERVQQLVNDPPKEMQEAAVSNAHYLTFTSDLGSVGNAALGFTNSHPLIKIIMPFVRTPTNIFKFALERSPAAAIMRETVVKPHQRGGAAADTVKGRLAFAAGIAAVTTSEALKGNITGAGPRDPELRRVWMTRNRPYSIKVPAAVVQAVEQRLGTKIGDQAANGDMWVSYGRIEPFASLVGVMADTAEIASHIDDPEMRDRLASQVVTAINQNLLNKTFISGLTRSILAFYDPEHYGESFVEGLARTVIPNVIGQYSRTQDPVLREIDGALEAVKARIPGYSETLPAQRNIWGEPIILDRGLGPDIISPFYSHRMEPDPTSDEMVRLGARLPRPGRELKGIELTNEEYSQLQEMTGKPAKQALDLLVGSPDYNKLPDIKKKELAEGIYRRFRDAARTRMFMAIVQSDPGRAAAPILEHIEQLKGAPIQ